MPSLRVGGSSPIGPMSFGNGTYVALTMFGGVISSTDGLDWRPYETGIVDGRQLARVAFGAGRFVAIGTAGTLITSVYRARPPKLLPPLGGGPTPPAMVTC